MLSSNLYSNEDIECILRDFSVAEKLDIKTLLSKHEHKKQRNKQKKNSKKYKIIMNNNKRVLEQKINLDLERIQYFKKLKKINGSILNEISNFDTEYGKTKMKLKLLSIACKHNMEKYIINLYLQIISSPPYNYSKKEKKLINRVGEYMESINYKKMQFKELSNQLIPLDFYNTYTLELDDWQLEVIKHIDNNESILVSAPTSCGKTWISLYPGILEKKILFIVPTEALVYQVGALFSKFVAQPTLISDNILYETDNNIVIGTPRAVEEKLPILDIDFDIIIIDEVHNLNNLGISHYYERLLKIFSNKQILALSATIGKPDALMDWLKNIGYSNIKLILYTTRFLNLQRQVFIDNVLQKIHPISCLTIEDINENFLNRNLPMTPVDNIILYETLLEYFPEDMKQLDINIVFPKKNKRLSLDDSRLYENLLKEKLVELKKVNKDQLQKVLKKYELGNSLCDENINLYNLFREIKNKKLTPCIVFQENTNNCKEIFETLVHYLERLETLNYPYYYQNLEYQQRQYLNSRNQIAKFKEQIKLGKDIANPKDIIEERVFAKEQELNKLFLENYKKRLHKQILTIQKSDLIKENVKNVQIENITTELDYFCRNCKLKYIDVFKKHIDFSLNNDSPMTAAAIRDIKKTISNHLNINVSYTNVFIQGLKRGVGIYTKHMPFIYNLIVQKLSQNGELGFVVADDRLALGINMPFRSSCILGYNGDNKFKIDNYIQMIGRAGRRGKDKEGHIIFANVDWKYLMKSELNSIISPYRHVPNYNILSHLTDTYDSTIDQIFKNPMNNITIETPLDVKIYDKKFLNIIVWKLKLYDKKIINFCNHITNINKKLSFETKHASLHHLIKIFSEYFFDTDIEFHLSQAINHNIQMTAVVTREIHEYIYILKSIYNSVYGSREQHTMTRLLCQIKYSYDTFIDILNKSCDLN